MKYLKDEETKKLVSELDNPSFKLIQDVTSLTNGVSELFKYIAFPDYKRLFSFLKITIGKDEAEFNELISKLLKLNPKSVAEKVTSELTTIRGLLNNNLKTVPDVVDFDRQKIHFVTLKHIEDIQERLGEFLIEAQHSLKNVKGKSLKYLKDNEAKEILSKTDNPSKELTDAIILLTEGVNDLLTSTRICHYKKLHSVLEIIISRAEQHLITILPIHLELPKDKTGKALSALKKIAGLLRDDVQMVSSLTLAHLKIIQRSLKELMYFKYLKSDEANTILLKINNPSKELTDAVVFLTDNIQELLTITQAREALNALKKVESSFCDKVRIKLPPMDEDMMQTINLIAQKHFQDIRECLKLVLYDNDDYGLILFQKSIEDGKAMKQGKCLDIKEWAAYKFMKKEGAARKRIELC